MIRLDLISIKEQSNLRIFSIFVIQTMNKLFSSIHSPHPTNFSQTASSPNLTKTTHRYFQHTLLDDISNNRVKEMVLNHRNLKEIIDENLNLQARRQHREEVKSSVAFLKHFEERKWLMKKGKKYLIDFDNQERKEMKQYFNSLDEKKTGSIGIDELQQMLLSVGLSETREEIKALIDSVDQDKSGKIQFGQFLSMIQNDEGQNQQIVSFFKSVIGGSARKQLKRKKLKASVSGDSQVKHVPKSYVTEILNKYPYPKGLSFEMLISYIRRKHMMTALNIGRRGRKLECSNQSIGENSVQQIVKGQRVMQALHKMYQRKVIRQIKQSKRGIQLISNNLKLQTKSSSFNLLPSKFSLK